jgi:hypothetical protein
MSSFASFLANLDLEKYAGALEALGATEVSHLADVDDDICEALNLRPLEKKRLTRALQALTHAGSASGTSTATAEQTAPSAKRKSSEIVPAVKPSTKRKSSEMVPTAKKTKTDASAPCIFWLKGRRACKKGDACKHPHSRRDPKDEVRRHTACFESHGANAAVCSRRKKAQLHQKCAPIGLQIHASEGSSALLPLPHALRCKLANLDTINDPLAANPLPWDRCPFAHVPPLKKVKPEPLDGLSATHKERPKPTRGTTTAEPSAHELVAPASVRTPHPALAHLEIRSSIRLQHGGGVLIWVSHRL